MIVHVDMDAFFASVEQLDNPDLEGQCVIVGRLSDRGVVSAASYAARAYGVRSAMSVVKARQLCPSAVFVPPRMDRYKAVSKRIMQVLSEFSPLVEPVSIDEAYLDMTGCEGLFGEPETYGRAIRDSVYAASGLSCSVGVAPLRFLAKIASDMDKPGGLTIIDPDEVADFIDSLPVERVPGVGGVTRRELAHLGIETLGDVRRFPDAVIFKKLGKFGKRLKALSAGRDNAAVAPPSHPKSVSTETTLSEDTGDMSLLMQHLLRQAEEVCMELRKLDATARVVMIKLKTPDFKTTTRQVTLDAPTRFEGTVYRQAVVLLKKKPAVKQVRLIGTGVSGLSFGSSGKQLDLFQAGDGREQQWERVAGSVDALAGKYGKGVIKKGSLIK
ncbi:MAG: DNA polymerase IV [Thermodesulfobacteriota bacterium]|nr:DNA polymerase IV [Thermodesulfobacteriota bacterium]